jgi:hypothetical protein
MADAKNSQLLLQVEAKEGGKSSQGSSDYSPHNFKCFHHG